MMGLAQLHTLIRAQVQAGDRHALLQADMAPERAPSSIEQRVLATWWRARETANSTGNPLHLIADNDEWTARTHNQR